MAFPKKLKHYFHYFFSEKYISKLFTSEMTARVSNMLRVLAEVVEDPSVSAFSSMWKNKFRLKLPMLYVFSPRDGWQGAQRRHLWWTSLGAFREGLACLKATA